jgi:hypothetical protein
VFSHAKTMLAFANRKISLGKFGTFKANALIGQPFGLTYQIINNQGDIKPARNMALEDRSK